MRTNPLGVCSSLLLVSSTVIFAPACARSDEAQPPPGGPDAAQESGAGEIDGARANPFGKAEVMHAWTRMDWFWRSAAERQAYLSGGIYKAATLAGVDVDRTGNVYVTTPRW